MATFILYQNVTTIKGEKVRVPVRIEYDERTLLALKGEPTNLELLTDMPGAESIQQGLTALTVKHFGPKT